MKLPNNPLTSLQASLREPAIIIAGTRALLTAMFLIMLRDRYWDDEAPLAGANWSTVGVNETLSEGSE
jgi:hypothetical protein